MDWKERYHILFEDSLLSNFCQLGGILSQRYAIINPCGVGWGRFCAQKRTKNRMCKRAFRVRVGWYPIMNIVSVPSLWRKPFLSLWVLLDGVPPCACNFNWGAITILQPTTAPHCVQCCKVYDRAWRNMRVKLDNTCAVITSFRPGNFVTLPFEPTVAKKKFKALRQQSRA